MTCSFSGAVRKPRWISSRTILELQITARSRGCSSIAFSAWHT
jgi:hypothetical protein